MAPPNHQQSKPPSDPPLLPPSCPSHHSTKKRVLNGSPSNSTSSESSSLKQLPKRITRNLPNVSDCHGCQTRITLTNPKDRLQTLDSYWRIVLLCKKCTNLVNCAQICSYCFKETANLDCFSCCRCQRCIHKNCVLRYDNSSPWSYSCKERGTELDFSVCIDCWVPKLLKNPKGCRRAGSSSRPTRIGSKVSLNDYDDKLLENFTNDSNSEVNKEIVVSTKEKEKNLRKVVVVNNDMTKAELATNDEADDNINGALMVSNRITCSSSSSISTNGASMDKKANNEWNNIVSKSIELGKTHGECREIVVYRRTRLREKCSMNVSEASDSARDNEISSSFDLSRTDAKLNKDGTYFDLGSNEHKVRTYQRTRLKSKTLQVNENPSVYAKDKGATYFDFSRNEHKVRTYKRTRLKGKTLQENERNDLFSSLGERCTFGVDSRVVSKSQPFQRDHLTHESHLCQARIPFPVKCDGVVAMQTESCNATEDNYMLKYSRRCIVSKSVDHEFPLHEVIIPCQVKCDDKSCSAKEDRYSLKYSRRHKGHVPETKTIPAGLDHETGIHGDALSLELPLNEVTSPCLVKCDGKVNSQQVSCDEKESYSLKHSKRCIGPVPGLQTRAAVCQVTIPFPVKCRDMINLQEDSSNIKDRHYLLKYSKRHTGSKVKLDDKGSMHGDALRHTESDPGLPRSDFAESGTSSNALTVQ